MLARNKNYATAAEATMLLYLFGLWLED